MLSDVSIFKRWSECGLDPGHILQIPNHIGSRFMRGEGALLNIEHACLCKKCDGKDHLVIFVEREQLPRWLGSLLRRSAARRRKKS